MQPSHILFLILAYFGILLAISYFTKKDGSNNEFFKASRKSPWYLVAFGMIGASLSGVTFISVPGWVESSQFGYYQVVLGYILGYLVVGLVLLPLYYRLNLTSIYTYLEGRFGNISYKTGASFFLLSRLIGSSFRLYLVAVVFQTLIFDAAGFPFWATVSVTILFIWLYTFKSGIKTIVFTDTLQTLFMLSAAGVAIYYLSNSLGIAGSDLIGFVSESELSKMFFFEDYKSANFFWKQFLSGAFITIVMTGLDQDMMQKNLTCKTLKDAQKNMFWFTIVLVLVNLVFLVLGLLLISFAQQNNIQVDRADLLFPVIATQSGLGMVMALFFCLGLISAAFSSADGTLTALTTSFCIDILDIEKKYTQKRQEKIRKQVHKAVALVFIITMLIFEYIIQNESVIERLFYFAGFTYGPLLGLYAFGLFTKWKVKDKWVPLIAILSPILTIVISLSSQIYVFYTHSLSWVKSGEIAKELYYTFGFEVLIINGLLTFLGLVLIRAKQH